MAYYHQWRVKAMQTAQINVSDNILSALNISINEVVSSMRKVYAAQMYEDSNLSLGQAAELCGLQKFDFAEYLSQHNWPVINYDEEDLEKEFAMLDSL
jgi:predicted HTH domain antitoxin